MLKVGTVFSGIGAFEYALNKLHIPHEILFACDNGERELPLSQEEIMERTEGMTDDQRESFVKDLYNKLKQPNFVKQSYMANYPIREDQWHEDIRFLHGDKYKGDVDFLVGGSPCQSFSTYGKKLGLEDTRGTLFYDYARLIKEVQPKVFIYENVKNVTKHDKGHTWETMKQVWESLDYEIHWTILNAQDYGVPQLRRRLFLVGFRKDVIEGKTFEFPKPQPLTCTSHDFMEKNGVDPKYYLGKKGFEWCATPEKNQRRTRVNQDIQGCQTATQQDNWTGDLRIEPAQQWQKDDERIHVGLYNGVESVARKMTPKECLRMMGFMDFKQVVSDKVMYRQSGNSIVVNVLEALIKQIRPFINN